MTYRASNTYLENRILGASPLELVVILYEEADRSVRDALMALSQGDIRKRAREITRVQLILSELAASLDLQAGGELASRLADLYSYMQGRLTTAHIEQSPGPLEETSRILATLLEGWRECAGQERKERQAHEATEVVQAF